MGKQSDSWKAANFRSGIGGQKGPEERSYARSDEAGKPSPSPRLFSGEKRKEAAFREGRENKRVEEKKKRKRESSF